MSGSLVSVVVPTYNRAYCLAQTLDSIFAQTHGDLEVLLVDDGSTDGTRELVDGRYGNEPRLRYLHQSNAGVSAARNLGLAQARGDYIALLDSDDTWLPWKLEVQIACLRRFPQAGMVWSDMEGVDAEGQPAFPTYLRRMYSAYRWTTPDAMFGESVQAASLPLPEPARAPLAGARLYCGDIYSQMFMGNLVHTSTVLLTRQRFERVRAFDVDLKYSGEDYDFHLRTCAEGAVAFLDAATIRYRLGLADRLTRPAYKLHMARNFLTTVQRALAKDAGRVTLPPRMIRTMLADAHAWAGGAAFDLGDHAAARRHLAASLVRKPNQPYQAKMFAASLLPPSLVRTLREWRRRSRVPEPASRVAGPARTGR